VCILLVLITRCIIMHCSKNVNFHTKFYRQFFTPAIRLHFRISGYVWDFGSPGGRGVPLILWMRNIFQTKVVEQIKTHTSCSITFPPRKSCPLWGNVETNFVLSDRPQMTALRTRIAYRITKATNTHSVYVILIVFLPQQCLRKSASLLRYTCIVLFVFTNVRQKTTLWGSLIESKFSSPLSLRPILTF
jgi:hypothetical protein